MAKLEYCRPDLIPRQELQYLAFEVHNLYNHIDELVHIDTGLKHCVDLCKIMESLIIAEDSLYKLRSKASDCTCQALADNWHAESKITYL